MTPKHSSPAAAPTRRALYLVEAAALEQGELSPRRYHVVERGRRVLVGLSAEETLEFEKLEQLTSIGRQRPRLLPRTRPKQSTGTLFAVLVCLDLTWLNGPYSRRSTFSKHRHA